MGKTLIGNKEENNQKLIEDKEKYEQTLIRHKERNDQKLIEEDRNDQASIEDKEKTDRATRILPRKMYDEEYNTNIEHTMLGGKAKDQKKHETRNIEDEMITSTI